MAASFDFKGVITALVTPFYHGEIDEESFQALVRMQIRGGIDGLVVNGTTGESPTVSPREVERLVKLARAEVQGKIPVIVGAGSNCTQKTIENTQRALDWGADAALIVTPYYNKPPQRGLLEHYKKLAQKVNFPIILYNVPGRTAVDLSHQVVKELLSVKNIVGLKEAKGNVDQDLELLRACAVQRKDFVVLSGDDATFMEFMTRGGHGVISVLSNLIPQQLKSLSLLAKNEAAQALGAYKKWARLLEILYVESNPIPVKAALSLMGVIRSAELRLPLVELDSSYRGALEGLLQEHSLIQR